MASLGEPAKEDMTTRHPWPSRATWRWSRTMGYRTIATPYRRRDRKAHPRWSLCSCDRPCEHDNPHLWWESKQGALVVGVMEGA